MDQKSQDLNINCDALAKAAAGLAGSITVTGRVSGRRDSRRLREALKNLDRVYAEADGKYSAKRPPAVWEWLLDNHYIIFRIGMSAISDTAGAKRLRVTERGTVIGALSADFIEACGGVITQDGCRAYLEGFGRVMTIEQAELCLFPSYLRGALLCRMEEEFSKPQPDSQAVSNLFSSIHRLEAIDFGGLLDSVNPVERLFMDDPSGAYPKMDEASRGRYRAELTKLARRGRIGERDMAERVLELARNSLGRGRHVGYWLLVCPGGGAKKQRRGWGYILAGVLPTLAVCTALGIIFKSALTAILLLIPVWELIKSGLDYIIMMLSTPRLIPRLELSGGVPDEGRTVCVISALLTSGDDGAKFVRALEQARLCSRECGENLIFGLLADLKESPTPTQTGDDEIISAAKVAVESMNAKYGGGFYLFTRPRSADSTGKKYAGHERKRGALLGLARLLSGQETEITVSAGDSAGLGVVRYILTLDSDTLLPPGAAGKLIGAMLHPLNKPTIDKGIVTEGYGLIHPRISVELESAVGTDFARVFAGQGGLDPYGSLCGELYMDRFDSGGFAGKGILDIDALLRCCGGRFPNDAVLSHDALEGAFLRGGYMGDCELSDGFPQSPPAYFARLHRWTRGDWQNLPWIFARGRRLRVIDRFKLFDSLRRSLVAPATLLAILAGFFISDAGLAVAAAAALAALLSRLFFSLAQGAARRESESGIRYRSTVFTGVGGAFMHTFLRLWLLPYEAWICLSACVTALWRMTVSHKNLLQWQTAAQWEGSRRCGIWPYFKSMWFAVLLGLVCVLFSSSVIGRAAGLMWLLSPAGAWALALPARGGTAPSAAGKKYLLDCAEDIWAYFDKYCSALDNWLPPDNVQEQPPVGIAHRTSPTNIGLGLVSCLAAVDLKLDRENTALKHIKNMLDTLQKLPKWRGHLYNWYDTRSLAVLPPAYISTVDSGNLYACLVTLKNGLLEYGQTELSQKAEKLADAMDFSVLYDPSRRLMYIGYDPEGGKPVGGWYDLMASEARLTSYAAIAKGDVPARHWSRLSRAQLSKDGFRGLASWTGTMFEYLMPELFLPLFPESMLYENARFCLYVQRRRVGPKTPWGISESAYFSLDPALNYRYKASGCGGLALKRGQDNELVISPYSSFLALCSEPGAAIRNLRRLDGLGMRGEFGFYEALDLTPSRCRRGCGETVRCFMSHHQGMSIGALANYLLDGVMQKRFMAESSMSAHQCLLKERIPTGGKVLRREKKPPQTPPPREPGQVWRVRGQGIDFEEPNCCLLSNGVYNIMSTEYGLTSASLGDMLIYRPPTMLTHSGHGVELRLIRNGEETSLLPTPGQKFDGTMWELGENGAGVTVAFEGMTACCSVAVAAGLPGEMRFAELTADVDFKGQLRLSFEPVLAKYNDYVNHPAFWRLGLYAETKNGSLLLRRLSRGGAEEIWLCAACGDDAVFDTGEGFGWLTRPNVSVTVDVELHAGERRRVRFALCIGHDADEAYSGAQRLLTLGPADYADMPGACAGLSGMSVREFAQAMDMVGGLWFSRVSGMCAKEELWRYSLSGDLPIIVRRPGSPEEVESEIRKFSLLRCCGILCDLVFVTDENGEYSRPVSRHIGDTLENLGLGPLLDSYGGVHILPLDAWPAVSSCAYDKGSASGRSTGREYPPAPKSAPRCGVPEYWFDGSEFNFYVNQNLPRRCWANMLSNGGFGYVATDSGIGHMWYENAREMPISPWMNDPYAITGAETLEFISPQGRYSLFAANDGLSCRVHYGFGFARWEKSLGGFGFAVTAFVPQNIDARVLIIEPHGAAEGQLAYKTALSLSGDADGVGGISIEYDGEIFKAKNSRAYFRDAEFLTAFSAPPAGFTCDGRKWRLGDLDDSPDCRGEPVIGAVWQVDAPLVIVCGCCDRETAQGLCSLSAAAAAVTKTAGAWQSFLKRFQLHSVSPAMEHMMNGWCGYQAVCCRLLGRTSIYQSGGAFGFRDQLQDAVNVLMLSPRFAKERIRDSCRHQYIEGDVMHWWHSHPSGDRGVRTRCSDDLLWLVWAVCEYTEKTGDTSLCFEEYDYVNSHELNENERDRYETPARADFVSTVLEHARRAADMCIHRGFGPHGLLKFGAGDWNDGMDKVGGESVWLSWFFAHTAERFGKLLRSLGEPDGGKYTTLAEKCGRAANNAYSDGWYLRGYWPDGEALGGVGCRCCAIDSIAQSWAAMCPQADGGKVDSALQNAVNRLFDRKAGVIKLFDPPFCDCDTSPGYIESYSPGFRENGGQYTHGAVWLAMACLRRGMVEDGQAILEALLPENHDPNVFEGEPFVIPADVYAAPGHVGQAGWTWYTGSAGWYFRVVTEELLGIRLVGGKLTVSPRLSNYTARWTDFGGKEHTITVENGRVNIS